MGILCALLSLPVSIVLIIWLIKKKTDNPFEKGDVRRLIINGMLSMVVASVIPLLIIGVRAFLLIGIDNIKLLMNNPDPETVKNSLKGITAATSGRSFWSSFANTFLLIGLVEELSRFLFIQLSTRKKSFAKTRFDLVICGGIVGVGFQLIEDVFYANGDLITVIFRIVTPFHFTFGAVMGFFIGKALESGKKGYYIPAILIPALLHSLFDSSLFAVSINDLFIILVLVSALLMIGLTIFMIIKINKWSKLHKTQGQQIGDNATDQ